MDDPGRRYLYDTPSSSDRRPSQQRSPELTEKMHTHRASMDSIAPPAGAAGATRWSSPPHNGLGGAGGDGGGASHSEDRKKPLTRWDIALGNIGDTEACLQQLRHLVDDAVYLDEDAYNGVASLSHYTRTIHAQQRRIAELEHELDISLTRAKRAEGRIREETNRRQAAEAKVVEIDTELENNAVVFKMHYNELMAKTEEVQKLRAIIDGLSGSK